MFVRAIQPPN